VSDEERFHFERARPTDGAELEEILELQHFTGRIGLAYNRRPDALASFLLEGDPVEVIVCRDGTKGRVAGLGVSAVRSLFVNGLPREVGYLCGLRARPEYIRATTVLHRGYARLRELEARPPSFFLTSILEENLYARRLLEKKRPFMPVYAPLCAYTVFAMATGSLPRRAAERGVRPASASDLTRLVSFLCDHGKGQQFFPVVAENSLGRPPFTTLRVEDFLLCEREGRIAAAAALWDQRSYRQFRVTGYGGLLRLARPLSGLLPLWGLPALPRAGEDVGYLTLCLMAVSGNDPALFEQLLQGAIAAAHRVPVLVAGVAAGHPLEAVLAARRHISYRSRIYLVFWPEQGAAASAVRRDVPLHIECGLL
jgi:hypothetical protein